MLVTMMPWFGLSLPVFSMVYVAVKVWCLVNHGYRRLNITAWHDLLQYFFHEGHMEHMVWLLLDQRTPQDIDRISWWEAISLNLPIFLSCIIFQAPHIFRVLTSLFPSLAACWLVFGAKLLCEVLIDAIHKKVTITGGSIGIKGTL